ncbi:MAG: transcription factor Pcc1 [halophilic archaeon J07HB67]|nr:MAG: transcription factor Pcc1 [halophilic archaeon J07HB67]
MSLPCVDTTSAVHVAAAVGAEVGAVDDDRSRASVTRDGRRVCVRVTASDHTALRAGLNTWQRHLAVARRVADA